MHYKRIGHVIIPKPHYSSREGINSHCRRFGWLIFDLFAHSVAAKYYRSGCCGSDVAGHSNVMALLLGTGAAGPFNSHMPEGRHSR